MDVAASVTCERQVENPRANARATYCSQLHISRSRAHVISRSSVRFPRGFLSRETVGSLFHERSQIFLVWSPATSEREEICLFTGGSRGRVRGSGTPPPPQLSDLTTLNLQLWDWGLSKREMFDDQTSSNIFWWPNMLMLNWVARRLKHVWSSIG